MQKLIIKYMNYNKKDILNYIKKKSKIKKKHINIIIDNFFKLIYISLKKNNIVKINGFGKFLTWKKKKYIWINPKTKKKILIKKKKKIKFIISKKLKKNINKKKK